MGESLEEIIRRAEGGSTAYQIQLGHSYLTGKDFEGNDFPEDYVKARQWLERAHEQGAFTATHLLGTMYEDGKGVPVNIEKAIELYQQAVDRGAYLSCVNLARIYAFGKGVEQSKQVAEDWYRKVLSFEAEAGDGGEMEEAREFLRRSGS